jgi:hypothetical protein
VRRLGSYESCALGGGVEQVAIAVRCRAGVTADFDRYDPVPPEMWNVYMSHPGYYAAGEYPTVWMTEESLATRAIGAEPSVVIDLLTQELIRAVGDSPEPALSPCC